MSNILGVSCYYHDSAAALLVDGEIVAAAQEERFTRKKHDSSFPKHAINYCLQQGGLSHSDVEIVAFYDKPFQKFERILETYLQYAPKGLRSALKALPVWTKEKIWISEQLKDELGREKTYVFPEHHLSHAASAFYPSPFQEAVILTVDGVGEWATSTMCIGKGNDLEIIKEIKFPHSLGLLYSAFTYYLGFKVNSGEYKVMGLAPYGEPKYVNEIKDHLIDIKEDGSFFMDMEYFNYCVGLEMTSSKFHKLFGGLPRKPESKLEQKQMDLAASVQVVTEEIMLKMARYARQASGMKNLCLAGGVALNCVANGKILREQIFDKIWIQPAAGDAGGALGAAYLAWHQHLSKPRVANPTDSMKGAYLGPEYSDSDIRTFLDQNGYAYDSLNQQELVARVSDLIIDGKVIGWFQGRMEFGPRALGARSIIGDARSEEMQKNLNLKIKFRESFRPFAPIVMEEDVSDFFDLEEPSPYMLLVAQVAKSHLKQLENSAVGLKKLYEIRSSIPAVTHVDNSARIQTVSKKTNPLLHKLMADFKEKTGCSVLINTSFNVRGEPIVCTPEDAYRCFMRTNMDVLVLGKHVLVKENQPKWEEAKDWREDYVLD